MKSLVTHVELNTQQIKFLIDLMWGCPLGIVKDAAERHKIDDVELESLLSMNLGSALAELE